MFAMMVFVSSTVSAKSIHVNIGNNEVKANDRVTLSFVVDEIKQLKGLQFEILYDSESLVLKGTEKGSIFDEAFVGGMSTDKNGTIKVVVAFGSAMDFSGEICRAEFEVLDGKKNVYVKTSDVKVSSTEDETFEGSEIVIVVTDATESGDEGNNAEGSTGEDNNDSVGKDTENSSGNGSHSTTRPSGGLSNSGNVKPDNKSQSEKKEDNKETLFVDSDISSINKENLPEKEFIDTVNHWAETNILAMAELGIVNGVSENEFQPDRNVTRAEFATMISKALELDEITENIYSDVPDDAWYKDVVLKCTKAGLIQGSDGMFRPNDLISREEMAVILYRAKHYIGLGNEETVSLAFADKDEISAWAKDAVASMAHEGIINGMGDNMFAPKNSATRAQAVVVLERILKLL